MATGRVLKTLGWVLIIVCLSISSLAQDRIVNQTKVYFINDKIRLDGVLSENAWALQGIESFTQRELNYGQPSTENTKVVVVYDNIASYPGIWCYMKN